MHTRQTNAASLDGWRRFRINPALLVVINDRELWTSTLAGPSQSTQRQTTQTYA